MKKPLVGAILAVLATTAGCASNSREAERNPAPCPNAIVLADAARLVEFSGEQTIDDISFTGEITNISTSCRYFESEPIEAEIALDLAFGKGPKGADGEKEFKYFVAVTRTNLEVISKKEFVVPVDFKEGRRVVVSEQEINKIVIPRAGDHVSGVNFEIVVGFSLTPKQAIFNRSGKSLKFPELK